MLGPSLRSYTNTPLGTKDRSGQFVVGIESEHAVLTIIPSGPVQPAPGLGNVIASERDNISALLLHPCAGEPTVEPWVIRILSLSRFQIDGSRVL